MTAVLDKSNFPIERTIEDELRARAVQRGIAPAKFATSAIDELTAVGRQAEGITDEAARGLLLLSALENWMPQALDRAFAEGEGLFKHAGALFLLLVLGAAVLMSKKDESVFPRNESQKPETRPLPWDRFAALMVEGIDANQPPLPDYALSRESMYEDNY